MEPTRWPLRRAVIWGAVAGALVFLVRDGLGNGPGNAVGVVVRGAVAGAALFAVVAALRNRFLR